MLSGEAAVAVLALVGASSLVMIIICGIAAAHHARGPLGFTAPDDFLCAVLIAYNVAVGACLVPDHVEGPAWLPRCQFARRQSVLTPGRLP